MAHAVPWSVPFTAPDPARVICVYGAGLSWAQAACEEWAAIHGVPAANLLGIAALGSSSYTPASTAAFQADVLARVHNHKVARDGRWLVLGPGVPAAVNLPQLTGSSGSWAAGPGTLPASLWACMAWASSLYNITGTLVAEGSGGYNRFLELVDPSTVTTYTAGAYNLPLGEYVEDTLPDGDQPFMASTAVGSATIGDGNRGFLPYGRLGFAGWNYPTAEAQTDVARVLALSRRRTANPEAARRQRLLARIGNVNSLQDDWCALAYWLRQLGVACDYVYGPGVTPAAPWDTRLPESGQLTTYAGLRDGLTSAEVWLQFGELPNDDILVNNAGAMIRPAPGGYSAMLAQSNGHQAACDFCRRGGVGGLSDSTHRSTSSVGQSLGVIYALLRGMPAIQAAFHQPVHLHYGVGIPVGDPLASPMGAVQNARQPRLNAQRRLA